MQQGMNGFKGLVVRFMGAVCLAALVLVVPAQAHAGEGGYGFSDVSGSEWFAQESVLGYTLDKGLLKGYPDATFKPYEEITRGQVAVILYRMAGEHVVLGKPFEDVDYSQYYGQAITWARSALVINGYKDSDGFYRTFRPDAPVTREELCTMLANYAHKIRNITTASDGVRLSSMPDANLVSSWAQTNMGWAMDTGMITGDVSGGRAQVNPGGTASRCEAAKMVAVLHRDVMRGVSH